MHKGRVKYFPIPALIIDGIILLNAYLTAAYIIFQGKFPDPILYYGIFTGWYLIWVIIAVNYKLFDIPRILFIEKIVAKNLKALLLFIIASAAILYMVIDFKFSKLFFLITMSLFSAMFVVWQMMLVVLFKAYRRAGNNFKTIGIVGFKKPLEHLISNAFLKAENGYKIEAVFGSDEVPDVLKQYYKGTEYELIAYLEQHQLDELIISLPGKQSGLINNYMKYCDNHLIRVHIVPNFSGYLYQKFSIQYIENIATLQLREEPLESVSNRIIKRLFDIVFASCVLVFIGSWLFPLVAIFIKVTSKGPVFFSQQRSGKNGTVFNCLKFRSMTLNSSSDSIQATKNDARITKIGSILRKTSLDEFPQFFNVLYGSMSVVGPRPHMLKHTEEYGALVDKFMVRHYAKPGITGWAQVLGFRGETKQVSDMADRAGADIWYIENWNILLDLKIIVLTVWQVLFKKEENAF